MMLGHLAPFGPIAAAAERRWQPEWPCWTRTLPWAAALASCVFPDLDIITNILFNGAWQHLYYLPHSVLPYLPVLVLGCLLTHWRRTRLAGLTVLAFGMSVLSHLLLDVVSHGTVLFYPLWSGVVGWTFPSRAGESVMMAYSHSPNVLLELGVLVTAGAWWLKRYARVWRKARLTGEAKITLGYLSALPRHEGPRLLWLDKLR